MTRTNGTRVCFLRDEFTSTSVSTSFTIVFCSFSDSFFSTVLRVQLLSNSSAFTIFCGISSIGLAFSCPRARANKRHQICPIRKPLQDIHPKPYRCRTKKFRRSAVRRIIAIEDSVVRPWFSFFPNVSQIVSSRSMSLDVNRPEYRTQFPSERQGDSALHDSVRCRLPVLTSEENE